MKLGNIEINNIVGLAPMAGFSNPAYIKICEDMGLGFAVTELISAEAIVRQNKKTFDMLKGIEYLKVPVGIQIFGSDASTMAEAAKIINKLYKNVFIDINMGCPVPKVAVRAQAGAALLKDCVKIKEIVSAVVNAVSCPVTVKIRSGWDSNSINAVDVAKVIEKAGASAICIHPRTRAQCYSGFADWDIIKQIKQSVSIPVIGNGDIKSCFDAKEMILKTGCDLIMVGRGAIGNPWIFKQIVAFLMDDVIIKAPSDEEKIEVCLKHLRYILNLQPEKQAVLEMRMHIASYLKGIPGAKIYKDEIFKLKNAQEVEKKLLDLKNIC